MYGVHGGRLYYMITEAVGTPQLVVGLDGAIVKELHGAGIVIRPGMRAMAVVVKEPQIL
ncbi:hypothetical protein [Paenibacillus riograndensis]|uniref:hypothetical protein n=1 Tax=Paenibacillus riograndensis TaxID=483937 RepID=UPI000A939CC6|nr:hypothetical protein [Paenibacillus riograndensis]